MPDLWTVADTARFVRMPTDADDKYSRGVLGLRTGSEGYPGAAVLGVEAAWRAGIGMVRYLGPERPTLLVLQRRPETVVADGRVQAWAIGSGTDADERTDAETAALRAILDGDVPVVVDAGALDLAVGARAPRILTPHDREHARLRASLGLPEALTDAVGRESSARETAAALGAIVVLKGAETIVATPNGWTVCVRSGTPWLATAGTGDVLAGAIGAVVAGGAAAGALDSERLGALAATGAWLHGRAAALAAARAAGNTEAAAEARADGATASVTAPTRADGAAASGPITALDVAAALPRAVAEALAAR